MYDSSYWTHEFAAEDANDLTDILESFAKTLAEHAGFFRRIRSEDGSVELFCGVFADGNWDESLPTYF